MMIMVAALFAGGNSDLHSGDNFKELIPLEENPRIKYKGYSINILYESMKRNSLAPFKDNNLAIDYSSAYSDVVYDLNEIENDTIISVSGSSIYPTYKDQIPVRIIFYRSSDTTKGYYIDINIPCALPNDQTILYGDQLVFYSGNDPDFGAIADTDVFVTVPDYIMHMYGGFYSTIVTDENGKLICSNLTSGESPALVMGSKFENTGNKVNEIYLAKPGKYHFYGYIKNNEGDWITVASEFEVFE